MGKVIDLSQLAKWFTREAVPAITPVLEVAVQNGLNSEIESFAKTFAAHNNIPEELALSYAQQVEGIVIAAIKKAASN